MPTIDVTDTTLYYERTGQGPAMLFVHGMCGDAEVWADQAWRSPPRGGVQRTAAVLPRPSRWPSLAARARPPVATPALVLAGDRSHPSLRALAHLLAAALPDARFVELEECGHVTYAEQPGAFARAVSVFAAEISRRTTAQGRIR